MKSFHFLLAVFASLALASCSSSPTTSVGIKAAIDAQGFSGVDIDGATIDLDQAFGQNKLVALVFWQRW